jgi:hypothetical protein
MMTVEAEGEKMTKAEQIVMAAVDAAGAACGIDEVRRIATKGPGDMYFSLGDMAILVEEYGSFYAALHAIQRTAKSKMTKLKHGV